MHEVVLVIHLLLAVTIIGLVLLQRSSGGGLGMGGSGLGDFATARGAATALSRMTMICAFMFFATSLALAVIAKHDSNTGGLLDQFSKTPAAAEAPTMPSTPNTVEEGTSKPVDQTTAAPVAPAPAASAPATPEPPISTQ